MANTASVDRQAQRPFGLGTGAVVDYLGPAIVAEVRGPEVTVDVGGQRAVARLAFSTPYEPIEGDTLLVIGGPGGHYAIGVLDGAGRTVLSVPGDVDVHAVGGTLRLTGDRGVQVDGGAVELRAQKLQVFAGAVVERLGTVYQHVREMLSVRAGERQTVVDGASLEKARSASILTEETVSINGKQVHLG